MGVVAIALLVSLGVGNVGGGSNIPRQNEGEVIENDDTRTLETEQTVTQTSLNLISQCNACLHIQPEQRWTESGVSVVPHIHDWWDPAAVMVSGSHSHVHPHPGHGHVFSATEDTISDHCEEEHRNSNSNEQNACSLMHLIGGVFEIHPGQGHEHIHSHTHDAPTRHWTLEHHHEYELERVIPEQRSLIFDKNCSGVSRIIILASNPDDYPICEFVVEANVNFQEFANP